jgi:hypothetical protein
MSIDDEIGGRDGVAGAPATIGETLMPLRTRIAEVQERPRLSRMQSPGGGPNASPDVRAGATRESGRMTTGIMPEPRLLARHPQRPWRPVESPPAQRRRLAAHRFATPIVRELPPRRELRAAPATW